MRPKVSAPDFYQPKLNASLGYTPERVAHLRANLGIDAALLADEMGVSVRFVIIFQRKLGLRKMRPAGSRRQRAADAEGEL